MNEELVVYYLSVILLWSLATWAWVFDPMERSTTFYQYLVVIVCVSVWPLVIIGFVLWKLPNIVKCIWSKSRWGVLLVGCFFGV